MPKPPSRLSATANATEVDVDSPIKPLHTKLVAAEDSYSASDADVSDADANSDVLNAFFGTTTNDAQANFRAGLVAIVGRPNVGKSTLMNHLLGQKISITSRKPQTTRHRIVGIDNQPSAQLVYVDTPGIHKKEVREMNKLLNKTAVSALKDINVVVFVVDALKWQPDDELVLEKLQAVDVPIILAVNKVDQISEKVRLLPHIQMLNTKLAFSDIIPVSALQQTNLERLRDTIIQYLPVTQPLYSRSQMTDRSLRFMASEIVREKIMRQLGDELPYDLTVQIETFKEEAEHTDPTTGKLRKACTFIDATIYVERNAQKAIVVGDKGTRIKMIGSEARKDMESMFEQKIMLTLWVKVKQGWSDDERALKSLGYGDI